MSAALYPDLLQREMLYSRDLSICLGVKKLKCISNIPFYHSHSVKA